MKSATILGIGLLSILSFAVVYADVSFMIGKMEFRNITGTLDIQNENEEKISEGTFVVVEGWPACKGIKNAKFKFYQGDTDPIDPRLWALHNPHPECDKSVIITSTPSAKVRFTKDKYWTLLDDNFYFLCDMVSGSVKCNYAASFNRSTTFLLEKDAEIRAGGKIYVSEKNDASIVLRLGKVTKIEGVKEKKDGAQQ